MLEAVTSHFKYIFVLLLLLCEETTEECCILGMVYKATSHDWRELGAVQEATSPCSGRLVGPHKP